MHGAMASKRGKTRGSLLAERMSSPMVLTDCAAAVNELEKTTRPAPRAAAATARTESAAAAAAEAAAWRWRASWMSALVAGAAMAKPCGETKRTGRSAQRDKA